MGHLKDLRQKQALGTLTEEEKKELLELEADFKDDAEEEDVEKAVEQMSTQIAKSVQEKLAPLSDLADKLAKTQEDKKLDEGDETKFFADPEMGKISVTDMAEKKVVIQERKTLGKQHTEVSLKTVRFVQALLANDKQKLQILTEGTGSQGGFLVPEDFANMVIEDRRDAVVMRNLATVYPVTTDTFHLPNIATRPKAFWRTETAVKNTSTVTFGETVLTPYSLAAIVPLSNELVADASLGGQIVNLVAGYIAQSLAEEEDKAFWTGNGSGKPTGVDNYSYTTLTAGSTDASRADTVIRALYQLPQGYRSSAVAVANRNTWAKIATIKDNNGQYLLTGLGAGPSPVLRGLPTYEQNDLADGKMFIGDFSYYAIADRQGVTVDISTEATVAGYSAFERNLTFIRVEERVDGEMTLTQPVVEVTGLGGA